LCGAGATTTREINLMVRASGAAIGAASATRREIGMAVTAKVKRRSGGASI
jgi:hypothetical protein